MKILNSVEQRQIARIATEWMAGPYGLPKASQMLAVARHKIPVKDKVGD